MPPLCRLNLSDVSRVLSDLQLHAWLIYDFHGLNPIARRLLGITGLATRRLFVWLPARGQPVAVAHRIELQGLEGFPGEVRPYSAWQELHAALGELVKGKRVAMEFSPDDAVPYLDRVPAGVLGLVQRLGGTVTSSASLVTRFAATWSAREVDDHHAAAGILSDIARATLFRVVQQAGAVTEFEVQQDVLRRIEQAGLVTAEPPIVAFGPNTALPHYAPPPSGSARLERDQVVLLDLWASRGPDTVFADQTWMGFSGSAPPDDVRAVWDAVRGARDAVVERLRTVRRSGEPVRGRDLDLVARNHISGLGYGKAFVHRTGHSIDVDLHGSGPHLDSYETDDDRELLPGVGFSVEPGIYLPGRFGVRSEINVLLKEDGPAVTPRDAQRELVVQA